MTAPRVKARRVVLYLRVRPAVHRQISAIAKRRGLPHTIASVSAELLELALGLGTTDRESPR